MQVKYPAYSRQARKKLSSTLNQVLQLFPRLAERKKQMAASLSGGGATDAGDWQGVDVSAPFVDAGRALSGVSSHISEARF